MKKSENRQQDEIYKMIYYDFEVELQNRRTGRSAIFEIELGKSEYNCEVGSWSENFWIRTPEGMRHEPYSDEREMRRAVAKLCNRNNVRIVRWIKKSEN